MRLKDPELCKVFEAESSQRIACIEEGLARLADATPSEAPALRTALMREAHTLKGAARMAGLDDVGHLAHCLEDALADVGLRSSAMRSIHATLAAIRTLTRDATAEAAPPAAVAPLVVTAVPTPAPTAARATLAPPGGDDTLLVERALVESVLKLADEARNALHEPALLGELLPRLHHAARALRDVPFSSLEKPLQRTARDVARARGKDVYVLFEGGAVRIEPRAMDALKGALAHLLHNAIDHGIETPDERRAAGKIATGLITISASVDGSDLVVEMSDDGRGVDEAAVLAAAARRGERAPAGAASVEEMLFRPGFTTRADVSETSGRGVGLDAVRATARALHGDVRLSSTPGQGCAIQIRVPMP